MSNFIQFVADSFFEISTSKNPFLLSLIPSLVVSSIDPGYATGPPKWFLEERQMVWVWPIPSASENATTIYCLAAQATDDITDIRYEYQPLVALYACALAKMKDRKYQEATLFQQMYLNSIKYEREDKFDLGKDKIDKFRSS